MMRFSFLFLALLAALATGCAPLLSVGIDTRIAPDHSCMRKVEIHGKANKRFPNHRVKISEYLRLPDAEPYDNFVITPDKIMLTGRFPSPDAMPSDIAKITFGSPRLASNRVQFRSIDLVLLKVIDYEERLSDITSREEGDEALEKVLKILVAELMRSLHERFDADYDISGLDLYLRENLPKLVRRLYGALWELRRARRGGISFLSENAEWRRRLKSELRRFGIDLVPANTPDAENINKSRIRDFAALKLNQLTTPRRKDTMPLTPDFITSKDARKKLLASLQESISAHHGSLSKFSKKIEALLPKVLGAFLIGQVSLMPTNPRMEFQVRLQIPGHVIQTNGLRDTNSHVLWNFTEGDIGLSGYSMWVRSLIINRKAIESLGLVGFPRSINTVEMLFRDIRSPETGKLRTALIESLRECVKEGNLSSLEKLAGKPEPEESGTDAGAAQRIMRILRRYRRDKAKPSEPELGPGSPEK